MSAVGRGLTLDGLTPDDLDDLAAVSVWPSAPALRSAAERYARRGLRSWTLDGLECGDTIGLDLAEEYVVRAAVTAERRRRADPEARALEAAVRASEAEPLAEAMARDAFAVSLARLRRQSLARRLHADRLAALRAASRSASI